MHGDLCCKQTLTVTHAQSLVDLALQQSSIDSPLFVKNCDLCVPYLHLTHPFGCVKWRFTNTFMIYDMNIAMTFGMEELEWCGYLMVKNFFEDTITHFDRIDECHYVTERRTDTT